MGPDAHSLLQHLPWGVVVLDAYGTVLHLNEQAAHWWGALQQDLQGKQLGHLTAGRLPADLRQALQQVTSSPAPPPGEFFLPQHQQWIAMSSARQGDAWVVYWQDVTAQKQREGQNQARQAASDTLLRRTEAVARTGSYELELATGRFHFSNGLYQLFGEEPGAFVPDMALIDARSHADDVAVVQQVLARAIADHRPYYYQRRIHRSDGHLRTLECHGRVECDALGQPVKLLALLQDVTEREQAAQELLRVKEELAQRATANYTALYNSMDEGFCIVEVLFDAAQQPVDYRFLDVNPAFEKQTGLHAALGKTMRELVPTHEQYWFDSYGQVARTGEPTRFEAQGESLGRWFDVNAFPIGPTQNRHVAILFTDISERRRTEEALRESDARLRQAVGLAHLGICQWDYRTDTMWGNDERFLMLGLDPAQEVLPVAQAIALTHPDDRPTWASIRQQVEAQGEFQATYRIVRPGDGAVRWLSEMGRVVEWQGDKPARVSSVLLNVTADHEAAEALRQSEEQFRLLVTATSGSVYRMSADWTHMEQLIGKDFLADTRATTRTWVQEYLPAEDLPRVEAAIADAIRRKGPFELEHRVRRADGTVGWTHSRAIPVLDARGDLTGWLGAASDVSARKQAEEALRQSEGRRRRMMNVPHVGLLTLSFAGTLLTANDAFLDLMGYGRAEFEARTFTRQDFTPPEYEAASQRQFERVQQTGLGGPYEKEYLRRDGSRQWLMFVAAALGDGTLVEYAVDISARKQAETGLRESEQRQRVLIENLPGAAVFVVDRELRYQLAEGEALRQAGFEPADFRGRAVRDVTPPAHWPAFRDLFQQALAGRAFEYEHEQGGRSFVSRGVPLPGPAGPIDAVLAVSYDITERKAAEEALRVSEAKYRTLFDSIDEGFVVSELLYDEQGRPVDALLLETNPSYDRITQTTGTAGRRALEVFPARESTWFEAYARVLEMGESLRLENYFKPIDRWIEMYVSRVGGAGSRHFASVFNDITARKRHENHAAFLDELSQALAVLDGPDEIVRATGEHLGAYLGVGFLNVVDVELEEGDEPEEARFTVASAWEREGLPSPRGTYRAGDYLSQEFLRAARAGEAIAICNTDTDPRVDAAAYRAIGMRAFVAVPVLHDGAWPGLISAFLPSPRDWRPDEVKLLVEVSHRVFPRIEHARAEEALRRSEEQFRLFVTASSDVLYRMDANWQHMLRLDGRSVLADTAAPTASWLEAHIPPADRPTVEAAIQAAIAGPHFFALEHRVLRADGSLGWTSSHAVPVLNAQGELVEWFGTATDITARQHAEEALRVSEAKYRTLFETMDQGFGIGEVLPAGLGRAADFRWLEVNPQVERLTGMAQAALLSGETMRTVMPELEDLWYERYERVALTGESARFEQHAQVLGRWFDVYAYPLDGPAPHRIALLFTNITARKQAEEALRHAEERHREQLERQVAERTQALGESQARLQSVFDSTTNAVALLRAVRDAAGGILDFEYVLVNPVTQAYHGSQSLIGRRYRDQLRGAQRQTAFEQLVAVVETGRRADFEALDDYEGRNHWFRLLGVKLGDGLLYTAEDITARKLLAQAATRSLALAQESEEVAGMGSWDYNLVTHELTWSDGLYHLLGQPVGSPVQLQHMLDLVLDDDRPAAAQLLQALRTGGQHFDATLRLRVGEAVKTVRFKGVPLPAAPAPPIRMMGVCLDVSDVHRLEAENLVLKLDRHKELLLAILQAQENERRRLGEVLHNGLGQMLYATKLHLDQLDTPALHALPALAGLHQQTGRLLADAMRQTRTLAHELVPTSLLDFGLAAAVRDVCRDLSTPQLRIACHVWGEELTLPQPVQVTLFRLVQELAHNIVRHAGATQATLELETLPGGVSLRAEDNGHGFDPVAVAEGLGLRTVRQAVALLGGTVAVDSSPEFGTHIRLRIPLPLFS